MVKKLHAIAGERVNLRAITLEDTDLIVKWRNNPNVIRNFIFRGEFTKESHTNWMNTRVSAGEVVQYIIEERSSGLPVGSVYLRDINYNYDSAEFGIFIGEDVAIGKGYGTETTKLFVNDMFDTLGLHRIFLRVLDDNVAACRSYEKAGFKKEGRFRDMVKIDGIYRDVIFMSMINEKEVTENE